MELLAQVAAVGLVLALLGGAVWLLKRGAVAGVGVTRRDKPRQLEVMERVALGPQHSLLLVRVNGALVLVGTGPGVCEIRNVESTS